VRQLAQIMRRLVTIVFNNRIHCVLLGPSEVVWVSDRVLDFEVPLVMVIERPDNGAVCPCLDLVLEYRSIVPNKRLCLTVIDELLQLDRSHLPLLLQDISSNVMNGRHVISFLACQLSDRALQGRS